MLILFCVLVPTLEAFNTAIENLADKVSLEYDIKIKAAKDCSAAAVLITAIGAVIVGVRIFGDTAVLADMLEYHIDNPVYAVALGFSILCSAFFVFTPTGIKKHP
jgi:hypothetical protein